MARSRNRRSSRPSKEPEPQAEELVPELTDDELEPLELIEELEEIEGDDRVEVTHEATGESVQITVTVGDMEKAEVIDAITTPLKAKVAEIASELRWRNVSVGFTGSALIPSAAKELVAEIVGGANALRVIVQRGYGDECVHEGSLPTVKWSTRPDESYALKDLIEIDTGDLEDADLAMALGPELENAASQATGKAIDITFRGNASPDSSTKEQLGDAFRKAGASRVALTGGDRPEILFDQVLEDQVVVVNGSDDSPTEIRITLKGNSDEAIEAMALVLPRVREQLAGQRVTVRFSGRDPRPGEMAELLSHVASSRAQRLDLDTDGELEQLWPPLLTESRLGKTCTIALDPQGRDHAAICRALLREAPNLIEVAGRATTIDWPADFELDDELEAVVIEALEHGPLSLSYTFGGADPQPVLPPPLTFRAEGAGVVCDLDSETGKPVELVRAIARRVPKATALLAGKDVTVNITGEGAVSRTMRRTLLDELQAAGASGIKLRDQGTEDIILPLLLTIETGDAETGEDELRVAVTHGGRDAEQIDRALARELESVECPEGATVSFLGAVTDAVAEAFLHKGAGRLLVDGQQMHPNLFADPERDGDSLTVRIAETEHAAEDPMPQLEREWPVILAAQGDLTEIGVTLVWPGATIESLQITRAQELTVAAGAASFSFDDGDGMPMQLYPEEVLEELEEPEPEEIPELVEELEAPPEIAILGRKDDATPPMLALGIDWTEDEAAAATLEHKLEEMASEVEGRRVLVVFRDGGRDHQGPADSMLVQKVNNVLIPRVAALLPYRARSGRNPAHFEVVHSNVEALPPGMKVRDPRQSV